MARQEIRSRRATKRIEKLYALVVKDDDGKEGVVRRDTPIGTQAWVTDDVKLAATMLDMARHSTIPRRLIDAAFIATFTRTKD